MKHLIKTWLSGLKNNAIFIIFALTTLFFSVLMFPVSVNAETQRDHHENRLSEAELAQTLAPIALYPDSLLTHILISSTYPIEVIEADRWLAKHSDLTTQQIQYKVEGKSWDASVKALIAFPRVISKLSDELVWTQALGDAFLEDEKRVLDSIQTLRRRAEQAGSLDKMAHVQVSYELREIIIEAQDPAVIYVPYYDTRVVYGRWHWAYYPPVFWHKPAFVARHHKRFSWGYGVRISSHFFFSAFHWQNRHVMINKHHRKGYFPRKKIVSSHHAKRWSHRYKHEPKRRLKYQSKHYSKPQSIQKIKAREHTYHNKKGSRQYEHSRGNTYGHKAKHPVRKNVKTVNKTHRKVSNKNISKEVKKSRKEVKVVKTVHKNKSTRTVKTTVITSKKVTQRPSHATSKKVAQRSPQKTLKRTKKKHERNHQSRQEYVAKVR